MISTFDKSYRLRNIHSVSRRTNWLTNRHRPTAAGYWDSNCKWLGWRFSTAHFSNAAER